MAFYSGLFVSMKFCCIFYSYSLQVMLKLWQTGDAFETMHFSCYAEHTGILETFITRTILLGLCGTVIFVRANFQFDYDIWDHAEEVHILRLGTQFAMV